MAAELFMRVNEVAEVMDVSESYAYKIIRRLNKELKKTGCITMNGRIDRKFFYDNFYSTRENREILLPQMFRSGYCCSGESESI